MERQGRAAAALAEILDRFVDICPLVYTNLGGSEEKTIELPEFSTKKAQILTRYPYMEYLSKSNNWAWSIGNFVL